MSMRATGPFDVTADRSPPYDTDGGVSLSRTAIAKRFQGDIVGTGAVEMLSATTPVQGSAGYVAIERVTASVHGRAGGFILQHTGTMNRGKPSLTISVVPDSGSGALAGIFGQMTIDIVDGKHFYSFDYTLDGS